MKRINKEAFERISVTVYCLRAKFLQSEFVNSLLPYFDVWLQQRNALQFHLKEFTDKNFIQISMPLVISFCFSLEEESMVLIVHMLLFS